MCNIINSYARHVKVVTSKLFNEENVHGYVYIYEINDIIDEDKFTCLINAGVSVRIISSIARELIAYSVLIHNASHYLNKDNRILRHSLFTTHILEYVLEHYNEVINKDELDTVVSDVIRHITFKSDILKKGFIYKIVNDSILYKDFVVIKERRLK